jgi:hypothetical protein
MLRTEFLRFVNLILVLALASIPITSAMAESGERPQIALSVSQASAGATIEVEGRRFEPDIMVTLALFQNGTQIELGTLLADDHGEFTAPVLLPLDLQPGQYEFHAIDEKRRRAIATLKILPDNSGQQDNNVREDSDSLLAPMPTFAKDSPPNVGTMATLAISSSESKPSSQFIIPILIALLTVSIGAVLYIIGKRKAS